MSKQLAHLITLPKIFEDKLFRVPDYQRGYAWESEQVDALLDDIEQLFMYDHMHYTGTIVIVESEELEKVKNIQDIAYDIVDGQQRLTTFSILLSRLIFRLNDSDFKEKLLQLYVRRGNEGNHTRVFRLNRDIDPFYTKCVVDGDAKDIDLQFISEKYLLNAHNKIDKWISEQENKGRSVTKLLSVITKKFGLLVYQPSDQAEAGMMFEVINNRGKPLTELDKVKNYLVYYAIKFKKNDLHEAVNQNWGIVLKNLAKAHQLRKPDEITLLRSAVICYFGFNKEQSSNIYDNIKKRFPVNETSAQWEELIDFVKFLSRASAYYECLLNERSELRGKLNNKELVSQIELIRSQATHASILPLYFAVMENRDDLKRNELVDIFKMIETVTFRVYMTRNGAKRTDSGQARLFWLAHKMFLKDKSWIKEYEEISEAKYLGFTGAIVGKLYDIVTEFCDDDKLIEGLILSASEKDDFYKWSAIRYFLMNYEQHIDPTRTIRIEDILKKRIDGKSNDLLSIEHIWAKANEITGSRHRKDADGHSKRRLGNFVLLELGINIQADKFDLSKKVQIYDGKNKSGSFSQLKQVQYLIKDYKKVHKKLDEEYKKKVANFSRKLTVQTIEKNELRYIKFAKKRWSIEWPEKYWE